MAAKVPDEALAPAGDSEDDAPPAGSDGNLIHDPLDLVMALPGLVPGTDHSKHEHEIMFVVDHALTRGGVNTPEAFKAFIDRQLVQLAHNGDIGRGGKFPDPEAAIVKLAKHLKRQRSVYPKG